VATRRNAERRPARVTRTGWRATVDSFGGLTTIAGVILVLAVVGGLIIASRPPTAGPSTVGYVSRVRAQTSGRIAGNPAAPVRIIEFGDYQCPFCHDFWRDTEPLLQREFVDPGIASLEFRDFIVVGPESRTAAQGAACAAAQGLFWPAHDILYLRQGARENAGVYSSDNVKRFVREAASATPGTKFDLAAFDRCLDSGEQRAAVDAMAAEASAAGVRSTPTFMINGKIVTGAVTIEALRAQITAAAGR
jgi:protein-disulfide isomerase